MTADGLSQLTQKSRTLQKKSGKKAYSRSEAKQSPGAFAQAPKEEQYPALQILSSALTLLSVSEANGGSLASFSSEGSRNAIELRSRKKFVQKKSNFSADQT